MELRGAIAVVTGAASGIGRALAKALASDGGCVVVAVDTNEAGVSELIGEIARESNAAGPEGFAAHLDVTDEASVVALIERVESELGHIELWCGNAGIADPGGLERPDDTWNRLWDVNVMAHVIAGRHLIPRWVDRGSGHLLITASAAGLLTNLGTASYAVTKHAAVALAEWIAITHGDEGVRVSCLCPQGVRTPMTETEGQLGISQVHRLGMIEPEEAASVTLDALREDRFLILPHPEVATYEQRRAADRHRWLNGMRRMQRFLTESANSEIDPG